MSDPFIALTADAASDRLAGVLTDLFRTNLTYWYTASAFHWNTVGYDFPEFHALFGEVYEIAEGEIDALAEWIRRFDNDVPQAVQTVGYEGGMVKDFVEGVQILLEMTETFILSLKDACTVAENLNEQGLLNYLAGLIDVHQKLRWKFRSILA